MAKGLNDKVVLITGTSGGQGREAALRFAEAGAHVIGCDVKVEADQETVRMVKAAGGSMVSMDPVDLGDPAQAEKWIEDAAKIHGRINILYNNAAASKWGPIDTMSVEDWRLGIRNELDLIFYTIRTAWKHLAKQGGVIINTASCAGIVGSGPGGANHAAAKGAVIALTKHLASEGGPHNIRVVSISPGAIDTPATKKPFSLPGYRDTLLAKSVIKRIGLPEDIAGVALFLASDDAAFITGANIVVDGGFVVSW